MSESYPKVRTGVPFWLPEGYVAITIPPFGVYMKKGVASQVLDHELVHWEQYLRYGLVGYYWRYLKHFLKGGHYEDHPMEIEAFERSGVR